MKEYEYINKSIKDWIENIVSEDNYRLQPCSLYKNIYNSTGDEKQLSQIFEVPIGLVRAIKDIKRVERTRLEA